MRRGILLVLLSGALLMFVGATLFVRARLARCAAVPVLAASRVGAPDFTQLAEDPRSGPGVPPLPIGWSAWAKGVQVGNFTVSGTGNSFQLLGIANALVAPPITVRPGERFCVTALALADARSETRLQVRFEWRNAQDQPITTEVTDWQPVRRWDGPEDRGGWSTVVGAAQAPADATQLLVSFHPASDDRVYLDAIEVRQLWVGGPALARSSQTDWAGLQVGAWPNQAQAALSFSFDWETAMGGLIHSRSDDPNNGQNALDRAMRMRQGVTTTLELFRPHNIRATYYANGYNFLLGNREQRLFMGNPTFAWATRANRWLTDRWAETPWFADDPYETLQTEPGWYFGDLVPQLLAEGQDIQSHTFSHMDGGLADVATWRADLAAWAEVSGELGVQAARSVAFPWSSSAGMSYDSWEALAQAGVSSVTRTNWSQDQYDLFGRDANGLTDSPHCRAVPGHEQILACPDLYLTVERADLALRQLDMAIAAGGMIDLWAHTEEVVTPEQIAAWRRVVEYAAQQRDAGVLWIAPLAEIADWQAARDNLQIEVLAPEQGAQGWRITNPTQQDLRGLPLQLPFDAQKITIDGKTLDSASMLKTFVIDLRAGQSVEVRVWPA